MTQTFAQISPTEFGTLLAVIAGMLAGFYALIKFMLTNHEKAQEKDRLERIALTKAVERMAKASEKQVAEAVKGRKVQQKGFAEAEKRNGHLGDQNIKLAELVSLQSNDTALIKDITQKNWQTNSRIADILSKSAIIAAEDRDALLSAGDQHIDSQYVTKQVIKRKEQA